MSVPGRPSLFSAIGQRIALTRARARARSCASIRVWSRGCCASRSATVTVSAYDSRSDARFWPHGGSFRVTTTNQELSRIALEGCVNLHVEA